MNLDSTRGNLPAPAATILGRSELVSDVVDLVTSNRLVTLAGAGGVGKTRLALQAGMEMQGDFTDGVWMIELGSVGDPESVPSAIATALGIAPQGDEAPIEAVAEALVNRNLLIVLDNCEHLLSGATPAVEAILGRSDTVKVLATSRESLWIAGEQRLAVPPLALDGGVSSPAVALFVERAMAVRPDFTLDEPVAAAAVIDVCTTLDGIPLGIELAAARMSLMSAVDLRDRLEQRYRLLKGADGVPERQQTLHHMVAWSYEVLDDDERHVLNHASAFLGGFDLASIIEITGGGDEVLLIEQLDSLVRKSLVIVDHSPSHTRYHLLETIRQFAEDQVSASNGLGSLRDRHATHFAHQAASHWQEWNGPGWRDAVDWVDVELANLRAAFRWSSQQGDTATATDVAAHAALIGVSGQLFETVGWAESLLESAAADDVKRLPRLFAAAGYACFTGRPGQAAENARRAAELEADSRYDGCEPGLVGFIEALARVYSGDLDRYLELSREVAALPGSARAYGLAAYVDGLQASGRVDEALDLTTEAVTAARELANPFWVTYALWIAGQAYANVDARRALSAWDEGVAQVHEHGVTFFEGFLARDAARLHTVDGDAETALSLFDTAIARFDQAGNVAQLIITLASTPALFERLGHREDAATIYGAMSRQPESFHHVAELSDIATRLDESLGESKFAEASAKGLAMDLHDAAAYTRQRIEAALVAQRSNESQYPAELTRREVEVLHLVAEGLTTREISEQLFISAKTADHHIQHIYTKIGVSKRAAATRWAIDNGLAETSTS